jgi:hypothetical protein
MSHNADHHLEDQIPPQLFRSLEDLEQDVAPSDYQKAQSLSATRLAALVTERDTAASRLMAALNVYQDTCMACLFAKVPTISPKHQIIHCPTLKNNNTLDEYYQFSRSTRYPETTIRICYNCHVPQYNDHIHPFNTDSSGRTHCKYYDIILPLCQQLYNSDLMYTTIPREFGREWYTMHQYIEWLCSDEDIRPGFRTNAEAMFIWWHEEHPTV